jgi:hypothetical protein
MLLSKICRLVSAGRPLWREEGSLICSVITQWSESLRTGNHIILSHLRLPQPRRPGSHIYIPQEHGGPVMPPGTGVPFTSSLTTCLLRLAGLRWRYSKPPPNWRDRALYMQPSGTGSSSLKSSQCQSQKSKSRYDRRPVNQYVLVPSPLGIKGVMFETFSSTSGGVH